MARIVTINDATGWKFQSWAKCERGQAAFQFTENSKAGQNVKEAKEHSNLQKIDLESKLINQEDGMLLDKLGLTQTVSTTI